MTAMKGSTTRKIEHGIKTCIQTLALIFFTALAGCTTQVSYVRTREPLEKERIRDVRVVAVLPFRNTSGRGGAAGIVESAIESGIQGFFKVVDRSHIRQLMMEQRLSESDIVNPETRQKIRTTGADTVICGQVMKYKCRERRGHENVREMVPQHSFYTDNQGRRRMITTYRTIIVPKEYLRVEATAAAAVKVIRLSDGAVLVSHTAALSDKDQGGGISGKSISRVEAGSAMLDRLMHEIIRGFLSKVVRTHVTEYRMLDKYCGDGVKAAKNGDWEISSRYFWARYLKNQKSSQTKNNIAVCIEATAKNDPEKIRKAVQFYEEALELDYEKIYSRNLRRAKAVLNEVLMHIKQNK